MLPTEAQGRWPAGQNILRGPLWFSPVLFNSPVSPAQCLTHSRSPTRQGGCFLLICKFGLWSFGAVALPASPYSFSAPAVKTAYPVSFDSRFLGWRNRLVPVGSDWSAPGSFSVQGK